MSVDWRFTLEEAEEIFVSAPLLTATRSSRPGQIAYAGDGAGL